MHGSYGIESPLPASHYKSSLNQKPKLGAMRRTLFTSIDEMIFLNVPSEKHVSQSDTHHPLGGGRMFLSDAQGRCGFLSLRVCLRNKNIQQRKETVFSFKSHDMLLPEVFVHFPFLGGPKSEAFSRGANKITASNRKI